MKGDRDYIRDLVEIRSMMERSSKFLSLSGWAGIMAGIYALAGAFTANYIFNFNPDEIIYSNSEIISSNFSEVVILAFIILALALGTAIFLSYKKAAKKGESAWNSTSKRLLTDMSIPLLAGGVLIVVLISKNLIGLVAPASLLFYGLAIYNISKFTYNEVKFLGITEIILGLLSSFFIEYSLILWAIGFGVVHIAYGIYMYFRYER